ncbi:MAG: hypothetical protein ABIH08_00530 [Candidatus Omnitrophota bacterium]
MNGDNVDLKNADGRGEEMRYKKGIVLFSVIAMLLIIALIGASLAAFFSSVSLSTRTDIDKAKALYLAEAGIAYATNSLRTQAGADGGSEKSIGPINLGDGVYVVEVDCNQGVITSEGTVNGVTKKIQLQYKAL